MRTPATHPISTTSVPNLTKWTTRTELVTPSRWRFTMYSPKAAQFERYVAANLAVIECS